MSQSEDPAENDVSPSQPNGKPDKATTDKLTANTHSVKNNDDSESEAGYAEAGQVEPEAGQVEPEPGEAELDFQLSPETASSPTQEPTSTTVDAETVNFGSHEWYKDRWSKQWQAIHEEIQSLDGRILDDARDLILYDKSTNQNNGELHGEEPGPPIWKNRLIRERRQYVALKLIELQDISQSLRNFAASTFHFFHTGFFPKPARSGTAVQPNQTYPDLNKQEAVDPDSVKNLLSAEIRRREKEREKERADDNKEITDLSDEFGLSVRPSFYTSEKYSSNFVLGLLIEQASHDLNLLQQIYYQRSVSGGAKTFNTFLIAEELGRLGLVPAVGKLLDERYQSVHCYLGNRTEVRLLPYHNSVLMGIPQSATVLTEKDAEGNISMKYPLNFTAIPHEIGHVLYRFGQFPLTNGKLPIYRLLKNRLLARPYGLDESDWRFNWLEEIFADAYGCLVAGPISVLGFQLMLADGPPQHLRGHLGDHPTPVLRPLLQCQILRQVRTQYGNTFFPEAPALLDARWQRWVLENWPQWVAEKWLGYTDQSDVVRAALFEINGEMMTGKEILDALQPLVEVVLLTLERVRPEGEDSTWTPNWDPRLDSEKLAQLHSEFVRFASNAANRALDTNQVDEQIRNFSNQRNQTPSKLLEPLSAKGTAGWRARSSGIDGLIEMLLFESWSDEGGRGAHMP